MHWQAMAHVMVAAETAAEVKSAAEGARNRGCKNRGALGAGWGNVGGIDQLAATMQRVRSSWV